MSDITRRDAVRRLGLVLMATGALDRVAAQEVHHLTAVAQAGAGSSYSPRSFTPHQFATLERLTEASRLMHELARPPRAEGTIRANLSVFAFRLEGDR